MSPSAEEIAEAREELLGPDDRFYAEHCLRIAPRENQPTIPLVPKPAQHRFEELALEQTKAGKPVRIIVLKARKEGISTWIQGKIIKRITTRQNHKALVVAHDKKTAGELFDIGETMYGELPDVTLPGEPPFPLKPPPVTSRRQQELRLGEPSRPRRLEGHRGINSSLLVDTANEVQAGRGFTYHTLHLSELGFWEQAQTKLNSLLNTVADEPGTMIVVESTANGYNRFRKLWVDALEGRTMEWGSDYAPLFIAWFEDPTYVRQFIDDDARERFAEAIGGGPYGDAESDLIEEHGCSLEQLAWRRWAIVNRCQGDLRTFCQEYPATWEEAFLASGRQVFSPSLVAKVIDRCERFAADPEFAGEEGFIEPQSWRKIERRGRTIEIPESPIWIPRTVKGRAVGTPWWIRWPEPEIEALEDHAERDRRRQYVVAVDSASGEETESGDEDYFAIQVINHATRAQVARWRARRYDADLVAQYAYLAALLWNDAWLSVETTGGYGLSIAQKIWRVWRYPKIYFRKPLRGKSEKQEERLGFDTNVASKPLLVDLGKELLRTGIDGLADQATAGEMLTYVKDERGRMGAEEDEFDDLLMAWLIAQYVAEEKPLRTKRESRVSSTVPEAPILGAAPSYYR